MKKIVAISLCMISLFSLNACGSEAVKVKLEETPQVEFVETEAPASEIFNITEGKVVSADQTLTVTPLELPNEIEENHFDLQGVFDENQMLVSLSNDYEEEHIEDEFGLYMIKEKAYKKLFDTNGYLMTIKVIHEDYILLQATTDNWNTAHLMIYIMQSNVLHDFYEYKQGYFNVVGFNHEPFFHQNKVYFDDIDSDLAGGMIDKKQIQVLAYDLTSDQTEVLQDNAMCPFLKDGDIYTLVLDEAQNVHQITALGSEKQLPLTENKDIESVFSFQNYLYSTSSEEAGEKRSSLNDLSLRKRLVTSKNSFKEIKGNAHFLAWLNDDESNTYLYDPTIGKIILFTEIPEGIKVFHFKNDYGVLEHYQVDETVPTYYWFKKK